MCPVVCVGISLLFTSLLLKKLERSLTRLESRLVELVNRLDAQEVLLAADNATLVLHQILRRQATGRVLGCAVVDLRLAARRHLGRLRRLASVLATEHFLIRSLKFIGERGLRDLSEK